MQDDRAKSWRVQAVSVAAGSFENRKSLPAAWMGLRDGQLSDTAGIPDCVFVHASGAALLHSSLADMTLYDAQFISTVVAVEGSTCRVVPSKLSQIADLRGNLMQACAAVYTKAVF